MTTINSSTAGNIASTTAGIPSPALSPKASHDCLAEHIQPAGPTGPITVHSHLQRPLSITEYANPAKGVKKRCRTIMTPYQSKVLHRVLEHTAFPSTEVREQLARMLGMKPRTVQIWFQNQRQKSRQQSQNSAASGSPTPSDGSLSDCSLSPSSSPEFGAAKDEFGSGRGRDTGLRTTAAAAAAKASVSDAAAGQQSPLPYGLPTNPSQLKFHGSVYKSRPGFNFSSRGNTAASISSQRCTGQTTVPGFINPPPQPQLIPMLQVAAAAMSSSSVATMPTYAAASPTAAAPLPLDLLASAVSNYRPNGYSYLPPNRLAPLASEASAAASGVATQAAAVSCAEKLPSLKALAQVAVELEGAAAAAAPAAAPNARRPW